ncbi:zf-HC2 domain-containing protein [Micromonospora marina]|uniref:Putative zinc-finger n=1 Tax=Micromonospora marina TaxID=307120 RepID=A0A1C4XB90_9ACTN|nr:zf-HC2 domain-containing protein [Micromonospora marina]SCF05645.1 Putative zinc-finger [Micromonospora marina]
MPGTEAVARIIALAHPLSGREGGVMRTGGENPTSEHESLALYLLGALDETDRVAFEAHLAGCDECLSAASDLGGVTSGLGGLSAADWNGFALPPPSVLPPASVLPPPSVPPPASVPPPRSPSGAEDVPAAEPWADAPDLASAAGHEGGSRTDVAGTTTPGTGTGRPRTDDAGPAPGAGTGRGPAGRRGNRPGGAPGGAGPTGPGRAPGDRPGGRRPRALSARRRLLLWGGAAALALTVLTGGIVATVGGGGRDDVVLTATGEAPGQGASLSVSITTHEGRGSTIRITATGLRPGLRHRLFAVTRDGVTHPVRDWTASNGPQEVTGELSPPLDQLSFVGVGLTDGTSIVTAPISR